MATSQASCSQAMLYRSVRACISQNGSYSRQAELRLMQALYPDEHEQLCSRDGDRHCQSSRCGDRDAWSSDDEGTAAKENDPLPHTGEAHMASASFLTTLAMTTCAFMSAMLTSWRRLCQQRGCRACKPIMLSVLFTFPVVLLLKG